jgi:type IV pilus assembly protein PilW
MKPGALTLTKIGQKGLTLVEIMIALLLGLFLIAGIGYIFLASKQSYRLNEGLSRLQEDGRFTMEILQTRLRSADYAGCYEDISKGTENVLNTPTNFAWDLTKPVEGFDNVAANATISTITTNSIA